MPRRARCRIPLKTHPVPPDPPRLRRPSQAKRSRHKAGFKKVRGLLLSMPDLVILKDDPNPDNYGRFYIYPAPRYTGEADAAGLEPMALQAPEDPADALGLLRERVGHVVAAHPEGLALDEFLRRCALDSPEAVASRETLGYQTVGDLLASLGDMLMVAAEAGGRVMVVPVKGPAALPQDVASALPQDVAAALPQDGVAALPQDVAAALPQDVAAALPQDGVAALPQDVAAALPQDGAAALPQDVAAALPQDVAAALPQDGAAALPQDVAAALPQDVAAALPQDVAAALPPAAADAREASAGGLLSVGAVVPGDPDAAGDLEEASVVGGAGPGDEHGVEGGEGGLAGVQEEPWGWGLREEVPSETMPWSAELEETWQALETTADDRTVAPAADGIAAPPAGDGPLATPDTSDAAASPGRRARTHATVRAGAHARLRAHAASPTPAPFFRPQAPARPARTACTQSNGGPTPRSSLSATARTARGRPGVCILHPLVAGRSKGLHGSDLAIPSPLPLEWGQRGGVRWFLIRDPVCLSCTCLIYCCDNM